MKWPKKKIKALDADLQELYRATIEACAWTALTVLYEVRGVPDDRRPDTLREAILQFDNNDAVIRHLVHGLDMMESPGGIAPHQLTQWCKALAQMASDGVLQVK